MSLKVPSQLIDKYLNGQCSVEEEKVVIDWYKSFNSSTDPISHLSEEQQEMLKSRMLNRIRTKAFEKFAQSSEPKVLPLRKYFYAAASIAAAVLIVFALFLPGVKQETSLNQGIKKVVSKRVHFTNTLARIHKYTLPDGSIIWLQPKAIISYNRAFVANTREVDLEGEAFFDVQKDARRPFLIHSGGVVTKVLGTSFNVKSSSNQTEVFVMTGKVFVYTSSDAANAKSVYLLPEQKATYERKKNELVKYEKERDLNPALGMWKKNTLSFDNVPVNNVIKTLNKEFKTNIILTDPEISHYALNADFTDVNLPAILELLCKSLNIKYEIQEDHIVISK